MHRRTVGVTLICISAFLYGVRYLSAAIYGSGVQSWSRDLFRNLLDSVGDGLLIWSIIALIIGVCYLIIADFENSIVNGLKRIRENWNEFYDKR